MEMTIDIGSNVYKDLVSYAGEQGKDTEDFALDMIALGLRVHEASTSNKPDEESSQDELRLIENNVMIKELMRCVFDKTRVERKMYDAGALIQCIENEAAAYLDGKATNGR